MPLTTVEPTRLYRQIADQIASLIDRGEFAAGARLPAERDLAAALGVSRTSVREAVICLELAGRVEVRVGTGIFVAGRSPAPPAGGHAADAPGPFEWLAARRVIEGEIAALAARRIRRRELAQLDETLVEMREHAAERARLDAADRAFHVTIARATGNSALAAVMGRLWDARRHPLWTRMEAHFHSVALHEKLLADHAAIRAALAAHDPDGARSAMQRHLARVTNEFQRRWEGAGATGRAGARRPAEPAAPRAGRRSHEGGIGS